MLKLRGYQREAEEAVFDYWSDEPGNPLVDLATGCHAAGTGILMHDGSVVSVEDIATNDNIMGPDGTPRKVLSLARGREMMYRVTPIKGEPFIVNEGHILSLKTTGEGKAKTKYPSGLHSGVVENIRLSEWIGKAKYWKHTRKLWRSSEIEFAANDNDLPVPPWVVGAMLGDGCVTQGASISNPDPEVLDEVCDYVESIGVGLRIVKKSTSKAYGVFFVDEDASRSTPNKFVAKLRDVGIFGTRAENKAVPKMYLQNSVHVRKEVLAGLLDADGHLDKSGSFDYISKSKQLSSDVVFLSRSLGLAAYMAECQKYCQTGGGGTYWRVCISGDLIKIPTRVKRKQVTEERKQKKNPLVTGFSLEEVGVGDYYGFELDGDHLYLTSDFTVHHNTGKSLVLSALIKRLVDGWPGMRIIVATHVAELIEQNFSELIGFWPLAPAGIFSAGVGRRDAHSQIIFAGIQTVHSKAGLISQHGEVDVLMVDEAHLIPKNSETMYGRFISDLREINPDMKIVGLTATPFRLDSGRLDEGDGRLFDKVVYTYGIGDGIADGYLAPLTSKVTDTTLDMTGVHRLGGDYKQSEMQAAVDKAEVTNSAVAEIVKRGADRRSWLAFCSGVDHALHVRDTIRTHGFSCETVTGETPKGERRDILEAYKNYEIRCLTNNSVLTTGFNHKGVDLLAFLRPTLSASLYIQMAGRATRPIYAPGTDFSTAEGRIAGIAAGPKPNALVMDFAGLVRRHGPIDMIDPKKPGKGDGDAPVKLCPNIVDEIKCDELVHISVMTCPCCGFEFPPNEEVKLTPKADITPVLSTEDAVWHRVEGRKFQYHEKAGGTPSVKVTYDLDGKHVPEWVCPQHEGFAKSKADRFWSNHKGKRPFPSSVDEFLDRAGELLITADVKVKFKGKWPEVKGHLAGVARSNDVVKTATTPGASLLSSALNREKDHVKNVMAELSAGGQPMSDDEIPF